MSADKIVRMANDIAKFMESKPHAEGVSLLAAQRIVLTRYRATPGQPLAHQAAKLRVFELCLALA